MNSSNYATGNTITGYNFPTATIYGNLNVGSNTASVNYAPNVNMYPLYFTSGTTTYPSRAANIQANAITIGNVINTATLDLSALGNINMLAATITLEGAVNITGVQNTIGNTSVEGAFEITGVTTLNGETIIDGQTNITGETNITGDTNITGLTIITGGLEVSALANLNGGLAVEGAVGIVGQTSLTGNLSQVGGNITTTGSLSAPLITTSSITSAGKLNISPSGDLALVNLSSINGFPYTSGANTPWYNVPAGANVNMGGYNLVSTSAIVAPNATGSNLSILAPIGGISVACPQSLSLTGNSGINLQADLGVNVNTSLSVINNLALVGSTITGVSTINGQPYGGSASGWANFSAVASVNLASNAINNAKLINVAPGQNFSLANSLTTTTIQGGSQLNLTGVGVGANVAINAGTGGSVIVNSPLAITASSIIGISSINGSVYPPVGTAWYNTPAGANVNMNNFNLSNANNVFSQPGELSFIVGGANLQSYIRFTDANSSNATPPTNMLLATKSVPNDNEDNIYFSTSLGYFVRDVYVARNATIIGDLHIEDSSFSTGTLLINGSGDGIKFPDGSFQQTAFPYPPQGVVYSVGQTWVFAGYPQAQIPVTPSTTPPPDNFYIDVMNYGFSPICNRSPVSSYPFVSVGGATNYFSVTTTAIYRLTFSCEATQQLPSPVNTGGGFSLALRDTTNDVMISGQMAGQFQRQMTSASKDQIYMIAPTCGTFTGVLTAGISYGMYLANPPYTTFGMKGLQLDNCKWAWEFLGVPVSS